MKRIISVFASIAALSTMLIMPISVSATGDINANQEDIYEISNANELKWAATQINSDTAKTGMSRASYKLMNDIDLDGAEWTPIGTEAVPFNGTFDGNGYRISNMKVTTPYGDVDISTPCLRNNGFFGNTGTNTKVENLGIDNIYVAIYVHASTCELKGTNGEGMRANCIGGMVGYARGTWTGCYVVNSTIQNTNTDCNEGCGVGAFASFVGTGATIENCYVKNVGVRSGQVKSMGGFFANSSGDINKINNCYSAGVYIDRTGVSHPSVTNDGAFYAFGSSSAVTDNSSKITNCYSTQGNIYAGHTTDPHSITPDTVDANTRGDKLNQEIEDIQAAFIDGNIFIADSHNINNEYPVLASQHINVLNYVYTSLVFDLIKGENLSADNIIRKLSLPQKIYGCNIIWSSSNNDVINSETGTISRNSEDTVVTITAIFSDGADTKTKEFKLTVKKPDIVTYETITSDEGFKYHFFAIDNEDTMRGYVGVYT